MAPSLVILIQFNWNVDGALPLLLEIIPLMGNGIVVAFFDNGMGDAWQCGKKQKSKDKTDFHGVVFYG